MGILNLKYKTARKFIKNQCKSAGTVKEIGIRRIEHVGVLAELSLIQRYDFTKRLSEELHIEVSELRTYLFDPSEKEVESETYKVCSEKDFGWNGKIKSEALNRFVRRDFDLLINYCDPELLYPKVIMLRSHAKMKVGFEDEGNFFNHISIKTHRNEIDSFNAELIKYLQLLKLINE